MRRAARWLVSQPQVVGEVGKRLARVVHGGEHFLPVLAQLAVDHQRDQVRHRDRQEHGGGHAVDQAAHGVPAFHQQERPRPPLVRVFQGEAGPDQGEERERQHGVLQALEGQHADLAGAVRGAGRGGRRQRRASAKPEELADPVAALVKQHQSDGDRNQQQVELAHPAQRGRFAGAIGSQVHLADGEARPRAGVALAAGPRQVLWVDGGLRIRRRQDVMHAVATRAVRHRLRPRLSGQPVVGRIEADQPVRGHAEFARQPHVAMAASAGLANVGGVHRRSRVAGFDDVVLAVAVGTQRGLRDAARHGLPVYARPVLFDHFAVAHAAGVRHGGTKRLGLGVQQLMRAPMAQRAIRRAFVAVLPRLAVDAEGVIAGLVGVASGADGLGDARRVGCRVVALVAGVAGEPGVSALGELLPLAVAGRAVHGGRARVSSQQQAKKGGAERNAHPHRCPVRHS